MTISVNKCTEFAVRPYHSKTGKARGWAVYGRAAQHDKWEVVKMRGDEQIFDNYDDANARRNGFIVIDKVLDIKLPS
jgi:hypothetical protein